MPGRQAKVVVDPAVPDEVAELLRQHRKVLLRMRGGWVPARRRRSTAARVAMKIVFTVLAIAGTATALAFFQAAQYTTFAIIMTGVSLLVMASLLRPNTDTELEKRLDAELEVFEVASKLDDRFVLREDLDDAARVLMGRAHAAIDAVTESRINAEGLLDGVRNAVMLPAQEWEIARLLAKLSALRTEHREVLAEGVTPEVAAVTEPLAMALASSERAVVARVEALERYAGHVRDAERAYRARRQIERLRATLPRYEELLAESGADGFAVPELGRLSDDADRLEQALRRSVSSAHEAFRHLEGNSS